MEIKRAELKGLMTSGEPKLLLENDEGTLYELPLSQVFGIIHAWVTGNKYKEEEELPVEEPSITDYLQTLGMVEVICVQAQHLRKMVLPPKEFSVSMFKYWVEESGREDGEEPKEGTIEALILRYLYEFDISNCVEKVVNYTERMADKMGIMLKDIPLSTFRKDLWKTVQSLGTERTKTCQS